MSRAQLTKKPARDEQGIQQDNRDTKRTRAAQLLT